MAVHIITQDGVARILEMPPEKARNANPPASMKIPIAESVSQYCCNLLSLKF